MFVKGAAAVEAAGGTAVSIVTDHASSEVSSWAQVQARFPSILAAYGCCTHGLESLAQDLCSASGRLQSVQRKNKRIVKHFRNRTRVRAFLNSMQVEGA
eukprot:8888627-Karenia_brevis.AAC.1